MINLWRAYPRRKPKSDGFYLCTIDVGERYVTRLYFDSHNNKWVDWTRQKVFEGYVVFKPQRAPIPDNRVYTDSLCDRTEEVIAWKKLPMWSKRKVRRK